MSVNIEFKLVITENSQEVYSSQIGYRQLSHIVGYAHDVPSNKPLFISAAQHPAAEVRIEAAQKEQLPLEHLQALIDDPSFEVRKVVVGRDRFKRSVSSEKLKQLIASDPAMACEIARDVTGFTEADPSELCAVLAQHFDPCVLFELADGYSTPGNVVKALLKHPDPSISNAAEEKLKG